MPNNLNYCFAILHTNREDLLEQAINSLPALGDILVICNNKQIPRLEGVLRPKEAVLMLKPTVPLTYVQSMNWLFDQVTGVGQFSGVDALIVMHEDALLEKQDDFNRFTDYVGQLVKDGVKWGQVLTSHDILTAFNIKMLREVGYMDDFFTVYFSDWDFMRRMFLQGWAVAESGIKVIHQNEGSNTFKADPLLAEKHGRTFPLYQQYYISKWGGMRGSEKYTTPFNV